MSDVRREAVHLALLAVERHGMAAAFGHPEVVVEGRAQFARLGVQTQRERLVVPDLARQARRSTPCVIDVALDLARGDWATWERAVSELDPVPAVLPALVDKTRGQVAARVLDVTVPVGVAAVIDPLQRRSGIWLERAYERVVAGPAVILVEQDQEQRRGVGRPEVGRVRALAASRELAEAQLVQDLAGLAFVEVLALARLGAGEHAQRRRGELGQVRERLKARDQAVAA